MNADNKSTLLTFSATVKLGGGQIWKLLGIRNYWNNQNQVYLKLDYKKQGTNKRERTSLVIVQ